MTRTATSYLLTTPDTDFWAFAIRGRRINVGDTLIHCSTRVEYGVTEVGEMDILNGRRGQWVQVVRS